MNLIKGIIPIFVGVAVGMAMVWFMRPGSVTDGPSAVVEHLTDLDRRLSRLERAIDAKAATVRVDPTRELDDVREELRRLAEQVTSLAHPAVIPEGATNSPVRAEASRDSAFLGLNVQPGTAEAGRESRQLEYLVTDLVASLAPRYLEEQVSHLYAAQKQADEAAQQEAEQRRRAEAQERRLAQMINDLQSFVPDLTATQGDEVAQAIQEQWEIMGSLRQQASEQGIFLAPGDVLRQAREFTDEKLYVILSPSQLEAFRHWREARFGAPEGASR